MSMVVVGGVVGVVVGGVVCPLSALNVSVKESNVSCPDRLLSPFKLLWVFVCVWPGSRCRFLIRPGNHCMLRLQIHFHSLQHTHTRAYPDEFTKRAHTSKQTQSTQLGLGGDWRAWYSLGVPSAQKCLWQGAGILFESVCTHTDAHTHTSKHVSGLLIEWSLLFFFLQQPIGAFLSLHYQYVHLFLGVFRARPDGRMDVRCWIKLPGNLPWAVEGKRNRLVASSLCFYETSEPVWLSMRPYVSYDTLACETTVIFNTDSCTPPYLAAICKGDDM